MLFSNQNLKYISSVVALNWVRFECVSFFSIKKRENSIRSRRTCVVCIRNVRAIVNAWNTVVNGLRFKSNRFNSSMNKINRRFRTMNFIIVIIIMYYRTKERMWIITITFSPTLSWIEMQIFSHREICLITKKCSLFNAFVVGEIRICVK